MRITLEVQKPTISCLWLYLLSEKKANLKQPKIPRYGSWENGGSHGFTVEFEQVRKVKQEGSVMASPTIPGDKAREGSETKTARDRWKAIRPYVPPQRNGEPPRTPPLNGSPNVSPHVPEFGAWDKSANYTHLFKENHRDRVRTGCHENINPDPPRRTTEQKKGSFKWLYGWFITWLTKGNYH